MSDPNQIRADNDFPYHACCQDCAHMTIQLGGELWCNQYREEVDADNVCERWSQK